MKHHQILITIALPLLVNSLNAAHIFKRCIRSIQNHPRTAALITIMGIGGGMAGFKSQSSQPHKYAFPPFPELYPCLIRADIKHKVSPDHPLLQEGVLENMPIEEIKRHCTGISYFAEKGALEMLARAFSDRTVVDQGLKNGVDVVSKDPLLNKRIDVDDHNARLLLASRLTKCARR